MVEIRKYDDELYKARYILYNNHDYEKIWEVIKNNDELLKQAIMVERDKFDERDLVKGLAICEAVLMDYKNINQDVYQELVNLIYSNKDIARLVLDGYSNGGYSYLLMTLWNHDLKLTEEQKQFAVSEAMNKSGTTKEFYEREYLSRKLDEIGITDKQVTTLEFGGSINPVGAKTANMYIHSLVTSLNDTQAHGTKPFDIRYQILRNPNWTINEKQKLVYEFWYDDETYDEYLEEWEWGIINDDVNYKGQSLSQLDKVYLYDYTYNDLFNFYKDREITDKIWEEIIFCQSMHELRPQQWELQVQTQKVIK